MTCSYTLKQETKITLSTPLQLSSSRVGQMVGLMLAKNGT